jgi:hypothetical protein
MDSRVIGVVIGLTTIYLFYSFAVTQLNEVVAGLLSSRARHLEKGIKEKLLDPQLGHELLNHPLIKSFGFTKTNLPSYIPGPAFAAALVGLLTKDDKPADPTAPGTVEKLEKAIRESPYSDELKTRLLSAVNTSARSLSAAEERLGHWFDGTMDRLSGAYKRHVQRVAFAIALVIVAATNADTLSLAMRFWNDPVARQAQVALAQKYPEHCHADDGKLVCDTAQASLADSELPIKWTRAEWRGLQGGAFWYALLLKIVGLLASTLAVSLGSPFWFDLLRRIAPGFAMAGKPPPKTGDVE